MGVPALFRWLSQKYPKIVSPVLEEEVREIDGVAIPVDHTGPNPNGEDFDNLYLDMNGIVHPCSHPEDKPAPETEEEMMLEIFRYTERVVRMVRPRKVLMMAVDGVAPRAKMNQQRSRRFRAAQEREEKEEDQKEFLKLLKSQKGQGAAEGFIQEQIVKKTWDSNSITPGTPFMDILAASLRYWVAYKLNEDPSWAKLKIIISDATVPGEGEHKIMEYVRSQRRSPDHDPNTRHVFYGLDADLIMLGLATHEPHFRILREDVFAQESKQRVCKLCGQAGHYADQCTGEVKEKVGEFDEKQVGGPKPFIWLHVSILREYLAIEMNVPSQPFAFDLERALDDWIFMCFFVGNDFLPHLPSLDIREQGIDTLITIWRKSLPRMGGYLTKDGHVDLHRAQYILSGLAEQENGIFKRRREEAVRREERERARDARGGRGRGRGRGGGPPAKRPRNQEPDFGDLPFFDPKEAHAHSNKDMTHEMFVNRKAIFQSDQDNKTAAAALKAKLLGPKKSDSEQVDKAQPSTDNINNNNITAEVSAQPDDTNEIFESSPVVLGKRKADVVDDDDAGTPGRKSPNPEPTKKKLDELPPDTVKLWEDGYADRYYEQKFKVDPKDIAFRRKVARDYMEGLCWVLLYYFQGCASWTWYYPHHYAPFAEDFVGIEDMNFDFELGQPFRPFEQLMGVLPAASKHAIPEQFHYLMTEPGSEIIDFYPVDFDLDLNGKKQVWQAVILLPFIDEKRLLKAMNKVYPLLSEEEHARNTVGREVLYFSTRHPLYEDVVQKFYSKKASETKFKLNTRVSEGLAGKIEKTDSYLPGSALTFPLTTSKMPEIDDDQSIHVHYIMPPSANTHKSMLLRGIKMPKVALNEDDIRMTSMRSSRGGRGGRGGGNFHSHNDRGGYRQNGNQHGRGGGYRNNDSYNSQGQGQFNPSNPFAAHMNPNFQPPPPHLAAQMGFPPPFPGGFPPPPGVGYPPVPPPQMNGYGGGRGGGYNPNHRGGQGYGGYNGGYDAQRNNDGYRPNSNRNDGHRRGNDSYGRSDGYRRN